MVPPGDPRREGRPHRGRGIATAADARAGEGVGASRRAAAGRRAGRRAAPGEGASAQEGASAWVR